MQFLFEQEAYFKFSGSVFYMKEIIEQIEQEVRNAFSACGIDAAQVSVTLSNRPDLCDYQCNGALSLAKQLHKAPIEIAQTVVEKLIDNPLFSVAEAVKPGFINMTVSPGYLSRYLNEMRSSERLGLEPVEKKETILLDYGGPNVAKPLHVGHLRSAIIGDAIKRLLRFIGHDVVADVHLGDWGLQMGLIITELSLRKPDLCYFDEAYTGEYPTEAPFTIGELEEIYPTASAKSKEDDEYHAKALAATKELQNGRRGYQALLSHILAVSVSDLKRNYDRLGVSFDLWKGESDADEFIPDMVQKLKDDGLAYESDGALVVDVAEEGDKKEIPPCMILKSDGAALYDTTDLATLVWRERDYHPDRILYIVDKRQELHFIQVFRTAYKSGIVPKSCELTFLGFGTMNGKDGKPFKTREGGVMRLSDLMDGINAKMLGKIVDNDTMSEEEALETAQKIGLSAIKYGDLSNIPAKDYVFDVDRFTSFEGNTGPYILYSVVRIKSILKKYETAHPSAMDFPILPPQNEIESDLALNLCRFSSAVRQAAAEYAPNKLCSYIYGICNAFNRFYHATKILSQEDEAVLGGYISLLRLSKDILEQCISLLGFEAPEHM